MHAYNSSSGHKTALTAGHYYSLDLVTWHASPIAPYTTTVHHTGGSSVTYNSLERPKLLFDRTGEPTHLVNGARLPLTPDWTQTIIQPLRLKTDDSVASSERSFLWNVGGEIKRTKAFGDMLKVLPKIHVGKVQLLTTYFGSYPCIGCGSSDEPLFCNGGLPQLANLTEHAHSIKADLDERIPENYTGYLVQDYENWAPDRYEEVYLNASIVLARQRDPSLQAGPALVAAARAQFHNASLHFLTFTLETVRKLRPNASGYGYYGLPTNEYWPGYPDTNQSKANDAMLPVWKASSAMYVSLYLPYKSGKDESLARNQQYIDGVLSEATRVANLVDPPLPIVPYVWYRYHDGEPSGLQLLTKDDTHLEFVRPFSRFPRVGPIIIWGQEDTPACTNQTIAWFLKNSDVFGAQTTQLQSTQLPRSLSTRKGFCSAAESHSLAARRDGGHHPSFPSDGSVPLPVWTGCGLYVSLKMDDDDIYSGRQCLVATAWDMSCSGVWGGGSPRFNHSCRNFSNIVPAVVLKDSYFGDNASVLAPKVIGGDTSRPYGCGKSWIWGTRAQPEGHRVIRLYGLDEHGATHGTKDLLGWNVTNKSYPPSQPCGWTDAFTSNDDGQLLKGPPGGPKHHVPWSGIWWDGTGMDGLQHQSEKFFAEYSRLGGELDEIVQDTELGAFNTWTMDGSLASTPAGRACGIARWTAIQDDSRWPPILAELLRRGFEIDDRSKPHYLAECVHKHNNENIWNALMVERAVAYWDRAVYAPARRHFPSLRGSDFQCKSDTFLELSCRFAVSLTVKTCVSDYKWASGYCIPDGYEGNSCASTGSTGAVGGGDSHGFSSMSLYLVFAPNIPATLQKRFNVSDYAFSAFNTIRLNTIQVRGMVFGGLATQPPTPVKPWIGWQNFGEHGYPFPDSDCTSVVLSFLCVHRCSLANAENITCRLSGVADSPGHLWCPRMELL
jgi:hypothetical protein